jgi:regulator of chromosome condensation
MPPRGSTSTRAKSAAVPVVAAKATKPRGRPPASKAAAPKKPLQEAKANTGAKRKAEVEPEEKTGGKRQRRGVEAVAKVAPAPAVKKPKKETKKEVKKQAKKEKVILNKAPTTRLDVFVFGSNSNGELGLSDTFKKAECPRPKFNSVLADAGIVQVSTGGMHGVALTQDNKILTWGVNDHGALGRDTTWEGGLVDIDKAEAEDSDDDDDEIEVNPREATPTVVDLSAVEPGATFTQVAAADSASFALTDDGFVYGWGTFRVSFHVHVVPSRTDS